MTTERTLLNPDTPDDPYQMYGKGPVPKKRPGAVRVWVDGCFDMLHVGHTNAIRQARKLGTELFVGCHTDEEIVKYKGPPVMHADERYDALRDCKWVDYVVEDYPYVTRLADIERFEVDFVVHGDDISVDLNGRNSYQAIIDAGRFKVVQRTSGISTTDLVGRMLRATEDEAADDTQPPHFYPTMTRKIVQYSNNTTAKPDDKIVYIDGSFDMFHVGHMHLLHEARKLGTYLIVGVNEDVAIKAKRGPQYPIMSVNERVLSVLSSRCVDEVVMGSPYVLDDHLLGSLHVSVVARDKRHEFPLAEGEVDPYEVPKAKDIYQEVDSQSSLTTEQLMSRVRANVHEFKARQAAKHKKDKASEESKPEEYKNVAEV